MKYSRIVFILSLLAISALIPTACPAPEAPPRRIAEQYTEGGGAELSWGNSNTVSVELAQSFQVSSASTCTGAALQVSTPSGAPTGVYSVRLETDNAGAPSGTLVEVYAYSGSNFAGLTIGAWNDWMFGGSIALEAGQTYWIVCRTTEPPVPAENNIVWVVCDSPGGYTEGEALRSSGSGAWTFTGDDLNFKVYK